MSSAPGWDARAYDESFRFVSDHAGDLVALLDPQPGERILDLGCGTGRLAAAIAECGASVTGVDSDAAMIEAARRSSRPRRTPRSGSPGPTARRWLRPRWRGRSTPSSPTPRCTG